MLRVLGSSKQACDGLSRRDLLQAGALSLFGGIAFPAAVEAKALSTAHLAKARSVILLDLFGGPSHIDTFDPKPAAAAEVRGEFAAIRTTLPGIQVCEHLPRVARWLHKTTLIRTLSHTYNSHNPYAVMTGYTGGADVVDYYSKPSNHPSMGSIAQYTGLGTAGVPPYVVLPALPGYSDGLRRAGPYGGYLGSRFNPLFATADPKFTKPVGGDFYDQTAIPWGEPRLPSLRPELTVDALDRRRSLLSQVDRAAATLDGTALLTERQRQAFDLLLTPAARTAFDLDREPPTVRDRYGRDLFGSSVLLARRLVEAGVTFVTVHTEARGAGHWDTHENNFPMLKNYLLPFLDNALTALLDELEQRGLLETTLVIVTGDMGRTPRIGGARPGRGHWPQCGFCLLAGGGVKQGHAHGISDKIGAFPLEHPVSPGDLVATVYHLLGIDAEMTVPDLSGRPVAVAHGGTPLQAILA